MTLRVRRTNRGRSNTCRAAMSRRIWKPTDVNNLHPELLTAVDPGPGAGALASRIQNGLRQIAELTSSELVAFDIGDDLSLPVDDRRVERVVHQTLVRKGVHAEQVTDALNVTDRPRQEVPGRRIGAPAAGILRQHLRRVVDRVERNREKTRSRPSRALKRCWSTPKLLAMRRQKFGSGQLV